MKDTVKMVISHFFIITVCVMTAIGVSNLFAQDFPGYPKEFPLHLLLVGATTALPSFLFHFKTEPTRKQFICRMLLHFTCIMIIVLGEGYVLGWYDNIRGMAIIAGTIVLVYLAVWFITVRTENKIEQGINEALKNINQDEE